MSTAIKTHLQRIRELTNELNRETQALNRELALQAGELGSHRPRIAAIQEAVCEHYELPAIAMTTKMKPRHYSRPRQIAMFLCRELTRYSLDEVGQCFGNRDHGTVMNACSVVHDRIATEPAFPDELEQVRTAAKGRLGSIDMPLFSDARKVS